MTPNQPDLTQYRVEKKFISMISRIDIFRTWIAGHSANFRSPYPRRLINNIYFDSYDYANYRDNLIGLSSRKKLRCRWYGDLDNSKIFFLEEKVRKNSLGFKNRTRLEKHLVLKKNTWSSIKTDLYHSVSNEWKLRLNRYPIPVLINQYVREYFVSNDTSVRITLDYRLVYFDQGLRKLPNLTRSIKAHDLMIIEAKFGTDDRDSARDVLSSLKFRNSRSSKYVRGVRYCHLA